MSIPYEKAVGEDLNVGHGTTDVTSPAGGTLTGNKISLHTFHASEALQAASIFEGASASQKIQAAHDALPTGGGTIDARGFAGTQSWTSTVTISKPAALLFGGDVDFQMSGGATELIKIEAPCMIRGGGHNTKFSPISSVGATVDVIRIAAASGIEGVFLKDFCISPVSGTPARNGVHAATTSASGYISRLYMEGVRIDQLGAAGVHLDNTAALNDGIFTSYIRGNIIYGGIKGTLIGDSITFDDNVLPGVGPSFDLSVIDGASLIVIARNNSTATGNFIRFTTGAQAKVKVLHNNIEQAAGTFTGDGIVYFQGASGSKIPGIEIHGNWFSTQANTGPYLISLDYTQHAVITGNTLGFGDANSRGLQTTANTSDTVWENNVPDPASYSLALDTYLINPHASDTSTVARIVRNGEVRWGEYALNNFLYSIKGKAGQSAGNVLQVGVQGSAPFTDDALFFEVSPSGLVRAWNQRAGGSTLFQVRANTATQSGDIFQILDSDAAVIAAGQETAEDVHLFYVKAGTAQNADIFQVLDSSNNGLFVIGSTGVVQSRKGDFRAITGTSYTLATMPAAGAGMMAWCSDAIPNAIPLGAGAGNGAWCVSYSTGVGTYAWRAL